MGLVTKHTLKNMWAHKIRTLLLLFCVGICSLSAMLALDMSGSLEKAVRSSAADSLGKTDIIVSGAYGLDVDFARGIPESTVLPVYTGHTEFTRHMAGTYDILVQKTCAINAVDTGIAKTMNLLPADLEIGEMQAAVSGDFAGEFGYQPGDSITLTNGRNRSAEFTICAVCDTGSGLFNSGYMAVITPDSMKTLCGGELPGASLVYIDIADDILSAAAIETLSANFPAADVESILGNEQAWDMVRSITRLYVVLFAVCLLLVVFVTISASQRIITEQMPVTGTFRSLGIPAAMTYAALLGGNIAYGLIGSLAGIGLYALVRPAVFESMFGNSVDTGHISPAAVLAVIVSAVLLECLCPLKEIISAVKTPIRDIIFSNKDTQYRGGKFFPVSGGIVLAAAVLAVVFFSENFPAMLFCFAGIAVGAALLFPVVLRFLAGLLAMFCEKKNLPIARMAAIGAREKKSTVGSAVLCFTATAVCMVVYSFAGSMGVFNAHDNSPAGVIVQTDGNSERYRFSYIETLDGVSETEYGYFSSDTVEIAGDTTGNIPVYGWKNGGYTLFSGVEGVPADLRADEIMIGRGLAKKNNLNKGDTVEIVFRADGFMPATRTLKVRGTTVIDYENSVGTTIVISEQLYKEIYGDIPFEIWVDCSAPDAVKAAIQNHSTEMASGVQTHAEYLEEKEQNGASLTFATDAVILLAVCVTFIGVVSNCLIGFEGRKRECAVILSTSLNRKQLCKMFLLESAAASGVALLGAIPLSAVLCVIFRRILDGLNIVIPVGTGLAGYAVLGLLMWVVFMLSALFPSRTLKKMNIAEQLKYE